jgi:hypothetical protein
MQRPDPSRDPHLAPGETVLQEFRPDLAGAKPWWRTALTALWSAPLGGLIVSLAVAQPDGLRMPWFLALPAGLLILAIAPAERAIGRRALRGTRAVLTGRQLLLFASDAAPRGIAPFDIRRIEVTPGPGALGTLRLRPALATLPALPEPDAAARRIAAWAGERAALWRDWTLARLAEAAAGTPDPETLTVLRRPDLGLAIALPRDWRVEVRAEGGRWTALRDAAPGWTALRAEGAASSRFELAVSAWAAGDARADVLAAVLAALGDGAGAAAEDIVLGPWRGVAATGRSAGEDTPGVRMTTAWPRPLAARVARSVAAGLLGAKAARDLFPGPAAPRRAEIRREMLLDAPPRRIRLSLAGHADAPEAWAVPEATAAALRPA